MTRNRGLAALAASALCIAPTGGTAHPHVFVDTALSIVVDAGGTVTGIEVTWRYDDFYSMLTFEDMKLDPEYDGVLTEPELRRLQGFDMNWMDGFEGDLYVIGPDGPVTLGPPEPLGVTVSDARISSTHLRRLSQPVAAEGLVVQVYDPTFYTAYGLEGGIEVAGGCAASIEPADLDSAYDKVERMLAESGASPWDDDFPEVGQAFADTVRLSCAS